MAHHNEVGKKGEDLAAIFLAGKGYKVLHQNWRYKYYEIDIVALKGKKLHFIEVKTRSSSLYGYPEDSVGKKKFKSIKRAVDEYLYLNPGYKWIQYDILSITYNNEYQPEFFLLEDVFL